MDVDDGFDDGFDDLTDHVLQELERNAAQLTQAWALGFQQKLSSYGWEDEDDDLDTTEVTNDVGVPIGRPVLGSALQQRQPGSQMPRRSVPPVPNPRWNPTVDPASRAARARQPSARLPNQPAEARVDPPQSQFARPPLPHSHRFPASQASQTQPGGAISALKQRVRVLEVELCAARGEVSIIRTNSTKAQHKHDADMAHLKKRNAEQLAEQALIVEAAVAGERSANAELQFLQRDMRGVSDRARRKDPATLATPRKSSKTWHIADGFDDMDMAASPSKGQGRARISGSVATNAGERTPTKGKRKRPVADSPMAALDTHTDDVVMDEAEPAAEPAQPGVAVTPPTASLEFLQLVLDHGSFHQQPPTFDTLSRFVFPSDPTATSLASIIFERLPLMGDAHRPIQLLVDFAQHVISLWGRCVDEQFWEPVKYLVALVAFTFDLHAISVAPLVVADLARVAQATMVVLAESRRRLPEGSLLGSDEHAFLNEHIDTTRILSLLYASAMACATAPSETDNGFEYSSLGFWRHMTLNTVLLLLMPRQKLDDIVAMLDLLASSPLPASIGPISAEAEPAVTARAVIERVSAKLTEQPRPATTPEQRRRVRLAALRTLIAFARSPFGALQLASHGNALPRLVTCLSASIDDLYDQPLPPSALPPLPDALASSSVRLPEPAAPAVLCRIISQSVLLIHALVTDPATANAADVGHKLSLAHGGSQRYLLALGRLTFAEEDLVIEAPIDGDVVEAAHELLELAVTPDEGETVSEAFGA